MADGLVACREHRPSLVVLEWSLPDGTSEQLLNSLAAELPDTRRLVLFGRQNALGVQAALSHGAHGLLMKQSGIDALREALGRLGKGGTYYCPHSSTNLLESVRTRSRVNEHGLSEREVEVLRLFAAGSSPRGIAERLQVSTKTVQNQLSSIRQKLDIRETAGLVRYAIRRGLEG